MKSIKERREDIKQKNPKLVKFAAYCLIAGIAFLAVKRCTGPAEPERVYEPWEKAGTACLNYVHQQMGGSIFDISTGSNKDAGNNLFKVRVNFEKGNGVVSVDCYATGDGTVKEVGAFKVRAK